MERTERREQNRLAVELIAGRVVRDGSPVRLSDKELELLVLLASAGGPVRSERIGEALWAHLDESRWNHNLKSALCRLRRRLGRPDAVLVDRGLCLLAAGVEVDLFHAEALVRACRRALPSGEQRLALAGIVAAYPPGGPARFERFEWLATTLVRIRDVVCEAAVLLARDALRRGDLEECIDRARAALAIDPFDDDANDAAIRAHLARGELGAGRRQFRRYAAVLADELQATPPPQLAALVR